MKPVRRHAQLDPIYHITTAQEATAGLRAGEYFPAGFAREGFTHCALRDQILAVARRRFHGQAGLVLLEIDRELLPYRWVLENTDGGSELFPHVYGGLPRAAVIAEHDFPSSAAGEFTLPQALGHSQSSSC